jgi:hypothetical protein
VKDSENVFKVMARVVDLMQRPQSIIQKNVHHMKNCIVFLLLLSIGINSNAQYQKFYHARVKPLEESFSDMVRKVPANGVVYAVIEVKNNTIQYRFYGNPDLLTDEVKAFFNAIKNNWNKKAMAGNKLLLPVYMILQTDMLTPVMRMDELMRKNVPPGRYFILEHLGVYNTQHD